MSPTDGSTYRRRSAAGSLAAELAALGQCTHDDLKAEWRRLYRSPPPKKISRDLLELGVAWKLQEKALGGLTQAPRRQLDAVAKTLAEGGDITIPRTAAPKVGARLVREWNGEAHGVVVVEDGFRWRKRTWRSLSHRVQLLGRSASSHRFREMVMRGGGASIGTLAKGVGVDPSHFTRALKLSFLSPALVHAILDGRQPAELTAKQLTRNAGQLGANWSLQAQQLALRRAAHPRRGPTSESLLL